MGIVEIGAISGYKIHTDNLVQIYEKYGMRRTEVEGRKLVTYWDEVGYTLYRFPFIC